MKPGESLEKKSNFSFHGFSRYLTSNMALQKIILTSFVEDIAMQYLPWFYFGTRLTWVTKDFVTPKRFKPRAPFFYTSKHGTWRMFRKKIKFFSLRVFQIFDPKYGSPENYSDFLSWTTTLFSLLGLLRYSTIWVFYDFFLLLNDSSHDVHFSTCQNMEPEKFLEKKIKFFLSTGFPDIRLQTWLSRKLFWLLLLSWTTTLFSFLGLLRWPHDLGLLRFFYS